MSVEDRHTVPPQIEALLEDVFFRRAHWHSAHEVAIQRLAQSIKLGALKTGSRLPPERELVQRLGVSRTTLREAIRALQHEGYLQTIRGRNGGTFVASRQIRRPTKADVQRRAKEMGSTLGDLIDLRAAAEPKTAELAAFRATEEKIANLLWLLQRSESAPASELREADSTLHIAIAHAAESDLLLDVVLEEQMRLHDILAYLPINVTAQGTERHPSHQHRKIVEAIAERDGPGARAAMDEHIKSTNETIFDLLDGQGRDEKLLARPRASATHRASSSTAHLRGRGQHA